MTFFFFKKKYTNIKAFTLLETLVSIVIVATVVIGPLTVAVKSSTYARETKDIMTATYLAEESDELLHNQYDSLYIACLNSVAPCDGSVPAYAPLPNETVGETVWRIFKLRMMTTSPVCTLPSGCSYDFLGMSGDIAVDPTKYAITNGASCSGLSIMATIGSIKRYYYACSGGTGVVTSAATLFFDPHYSRKVILESLPSSFEGGSPLYQDDIRITSRVSFKRASGVSRDIDVVDFLHARP